MTHEDNVFAGLFAGLDECPAAFRPSVPVRIDGYLKDGELVPWDGPMMDVSSPVCRAEGGELRPVTLGQTPLMDEKAALAALDSAVQAYDRGLGTWPAMSAGERIGHVESFLEKMREKRDEVVRLLMWEIGKTHADACKEFDRTCNYIADTINEVKALDRKGGRFEIVQNVLAQIRRLPIGVALCMGPYNYPLNETFTTLIPALIMGNTVVFKPAKFGVLLTGPLLEAFRSSFPPGVINVIFGRGRDTVGALMASGKVDVLAFIGTHKAATELKKLHPRPHRLRSVLGLDAKNPGVVLPDADLDNAVNECVTGALSFNGQRCTSLKILFVPEASAERFLSRFVKKIDALRCGLPWEEGVFLTPLPEPGKTDYLGELVSDAMSKGANVVNQYGGVVNGTYFHPAVLFPVTRDMRVFSEEQFGPVIPVVPYRSIQEVIDYVTESNYGQQISIFGSRPELVAQLVDVFANQVGRINLNTQCQRGPDTLPFNGRKDSAEGTLSVFDALRVFSIRSLVTTRLEPANKTLVRDIMRQRASRFLSTDFIL